MIRNILDHPAYAGLRNHTQFIVAHYVPLGNGKTNKLPIDWQTGKPGNAHDRALWLSAETACDKAERLGLGYGAGFVITANDPIFCIDIDHCRIDGDWSPLATEILAMFRGALVEVSQSGCGLHIFGSYTGVAPDHAKRKDALGIELYTDKRFIALTGNLP